MWREMPDYLMTNDIGRSVFSPRQATLLGDLSMPISRCRSLDADRASRFGSALSFEAQPTRGTLGPLPRAQKFVSPDPPSHAEVTGERRPERAGKFRPVRPKACS